MIKFYTFIFFIGLTFFARAQENKTVDPGFKSDLVKTKVLRLFPNPAVSVINFEFINPVQKELTLQIFTFIGKKVIEVNVLSQKMTIPLNDFYRGVYIFQVRDKTGRIIESGKFQINK